MLGIVVNLVVLWNTIYMDAALHQLRAEGYEVLQRMSPGSRHSASNTSICSAATPSPCPIRSQEVSSDPCAIQTPPALTKPDTLRPALV